ncbi:MAG TPA: HAD family hydrolase [Steroidobacteraceae bacterium]|nr:HAD family hydrolase [Steroidobacteraceae bacterium]
MGAMPVLSFDLDDTLWPVAPVIEAAERALYAWLRERHPEAVRGHDLETLRAMRAAVSRRHPEHAHDLTFLRHRALRDLFTAGGHSELHADDALDVFLAARNRVTLYDDVRPALERLRGRYRLFALSNGNADVHRCGLGELFAGHVTARAAGAAKPDPRIFAHLLELAGASAAEVVHVGDDPRADVAGAMQAGIGAVWINREGRNWPGELAAPARTIATLAEIE